MYHIYEQSDSRSGRLTVLSDDEWARLPYGQQTKFQILAGGFRTGLEAVLGLVRLSQSLGDSRNPLVIEGLDRGPWPAIPGEPALIRAEA